MKVFKIDDYEWWIGESLKSCVDGYISEYGGENDELHCADACELSENEIDDLVFYNEDGEDAGRSFRDQIKIDIEGGGEFPRLFASTEW